MTVLSLQGQPMPDDNTLQINIEQALESSDTIMQMLWAVCRDNPAKLKHLRLPRPDGSFDTVKSVLARMEKNIWRIQQAINRSR